VTNVSGRGQASSDSSQDVEAWDPRTVLRSVEPLEARLANGFLRSHPERWFPGLSERWAPLMDAMKCDVRVTEVKPTLILPDGDAVCYRGSIDTDPIVVSIDPASAHLIAQEVVPRLGNGASMQLLLDYLVQRFITVLGMCQTVSEAGGVRFNGKCDPHDVSLVASVRLGTSMSGSACSILVSLGQEMVERMDKLWRRQVHSSTRQGNPEGPLRLEVAQLGVPPQVLSEYLSKGTVIDLEVPVSDAVTLRVGHKAFMAGRLIDVDGKLACQTVQGAATNVAVPEGTSRLSIELASLPIDSAVFSELSQVGAILVTEQSVSSEVALSINQERVAKGRLCVYQGRYAVEVL
jgi:flagellar motor switch/type III secretory pathway protein FliN